MNRGYAVRSIDVTSQPQTRKDQPGRIGNVPKDQQSRRPASISSEIPALTSAKPKDRSPYCRFPPYLGCTPFRHFGEREPTEPWTWHGPRRSVTGATWGGCLEVIDGILSAGRFPLSPDILDGGVLIIETSERLLPARDVAWIVRTLGERGILGAVDAVLVARPPVSDFTHRPPAADRKLLRDQQRDAVVDVVTHDNPQAVICVGIPFGHTRPQWILPHGGTITVDGRERRVLANYR